MNAKREAVGPSVEMENGVTREAVKVSILIETRFSKFIQIVSVGIKGFSEEQKKTFNDSI